MDKKHLDKGGKRKKFFANSAKVWKIWKTSPTTGHLPQLCGQSAAGWQSELLFYCRFDTPRPTTHIPLLPALTIFEEDVCQVFLQQISSTRSRWCLTFLSSWLVGTSLHTALQVIPGTVWCALLLQTLHHTVKRLQTCVLKVCNLHEVLSMIGADALFVHLFIHSFIHSRFI